MTLLWLRHNEDTLNMQCQLSVQGVYVLYNCEKSNNSNEQNYTLHWSLRCITHNRKKIFRLLMKFVSNGASRTLRYCSFFNEPDIFPPQPNVLQFFRHFPQVFRSINNRHQLKKAWLEIKISTKSVHYCCSTSITNFVWGSFPFFETWDSSKCSIFLETLCLKFFT